MRLIPSSYSQIIKSLKYLGAPKRLRPRQARWALFFSCFIFHITCRSGSRNGKANTLSRTYHTIGDNILALVNFLLLHDGLLSQIRRASSFAQLPQGATLTLRDSLLWRGAKIFITMDLRSTVLEQFHNHPLAGLFGARKTTDLVWLVSGGTRWQMIARIDYLCSLRTEQEEQMNPNLGPPSTTANP